MNRHPNCSSTHRREPIRCLRLLVAMALVFSMPVAAQQQHLYGLRTRTAQSTDNGQYYPVTEIVRVDPLTGDATTLSGSIADNAILTAPVPMALPTDAVTIDETGTVYHFLAIDNQLQLYEMPSSGAGRRIATLNFIPPFSATSPTALRLVTRLDAERWVVRGGENGAVRFNTSTRVVQQLVTPFHPLSYDIDNDSVLSMTDWGIVSVSAVHVALIEQVLETDFFASLPRGNRGIVSVVPRENGGYAVHARATVTTTEPEGPPTLSPMYYLALIDTEGNARTLVAAPNTAPFSREIAGCSPDTLYVMSDTELLAIGFTTAEPTFTSIELPPTDASTRVQLVGNRPRYFYSTEAVVPQEQVTLHAAVLDTAWNASPVEYPVSLLTLGGFGSELTATGAALPSAGHLEFDVDRNQLIAIGSLESDTRVVAVDLSTGERTLVASSPPSFHFDSVTMGLLHTLTPDERPPTPEEYSDILLGIAPLPPGVVAADRNGNGRIEVGDMIVRINEMNALP